MTQTAVVYTHHTNSLAAGTALGCQIAEGMQGPPDVVILFASPRYAHTELLPALKKACRPRILVGCSSAGEFTRDIHGEGLACAVALSSTEMQFTATVGRGVRNNYVNAAREVVAGFRGLSSVQYRFRSALVLADVLAGYTDKLIEQLTLLTAGSYEFFGGGAGDNAQCCYTPVFYDTEVISDAVVMLEICSHKPWGLGSSHGWVPAGPCLQVTEAADTCLMTLNGEPAINAFRAHAQRTGQVFDEKKPIPFFLHNLIGIDMGLGYKLRVPLAITANGSIICVADIPQGVGMCIMKSTSLSAIAATEQATRMALQHLCGEKPAVALFFDCVATRLRMGKEFGFELAKIEELVRPAGYVGCNTYGQIVRADAQFSGFHNCTAVVCLIPD